MRTAFFGGSFDPPHRGHVAIATAAADRLALDRVLVAPVGKQPLKHDSAMASFADRLKMVMLAFAADPRCSASSLDAPRPNGHYNYTYETLAGLQQELQQQDANARLFCLLGADSFHTLAHWHRASELILLCDFAVATRPGYSLEEISSRLPKDVRATGQRSRPGCVEVQIESSLNRNLASTLHILTDLEEDVSADGVAACAADREHGSF